MCGVEWISQAYICLFLPNTLLSIYGLDDENLHLNTINGW